MGWSTQADSSAEMFTRSFIRTSFSEQCLRVKRSSKTVVCANPQKVGKESRNFVSGSNNQDVVSPAAANDAIGTGSVTLISARDEHGFPITTYICKEGIQLPQVGDFVRFHLNEQLFTAEVLRRTFDYEVSPTPRRLLAILTCSKLVAASA